MAVNRKKKRRGRMLRPREGRQLCGVCLAVAERQGVSVSGVRMAWGILTLLTGLLPGVLGYMIVTLVVPGEKEYDWYEYGEDDSDAGGDAV